MINLRGRKNCDLYRQNPASGFTLIEVIVALAIFIFISVGALANYRAFEKRLKVEAIAREIISTLQTARDRTVGSKNAVSYGVHFETSQFVLFEGTEYVVGDPSNETKIVPTGVEIFDINVSGNDVLYTRVRGTTDNSGTVSVRLASDPSVNLIISVPTIAQAGIDSTFLQENTRLVDSRHLHFLLGWSIQDATTLTLIFHDSPNPDTTINVSIADYLNAARTQFDWQGTTVVGGSSEIIHIYTHSLDGFNTNLSIRRDGRYNNKLVDVLIDGRPIVSYGNDGIATVGFFGGVMEVQ